VNSKLIAVSHHDTFVPICKQLAAKGYKFATLTPQFAKTLSDMDLKAGPLNQVAAQVQDKAFEAAARLLKAGNATNSNGLAPQAKQWLDDNLSTFLYPRLADLCNMVLCLDKVNPSLVLLHNDVEPITRATALWAKAKGVPCLHVPHAIYQDINRTKIGTDVHDLVTASHLAVAGPFQREWYEQRGASNVKETGLPQFDSWTRPTVDRKRARRLLSAQDGKPWPIDAPVVCYCATWQQHTNALGISDEWQKSYFAFLEATKKMPGLRVVVKCHPHGGQQNWEWHAQAAREAKVNCVVTPLHLETCLRASDVMVAYGGSNTVLEGSLVPGLRLVTTHGFEDDKEIYRTDMNPEAMAATMTVALSQQAPVMTRFQTKYLGIPDGKAAQRVTEYVEELLCQSS
jgi:hypothetical protein